MGNPFSRCGYINLKGHSQVATVRFLPSGELVTAGDCTLRVWHPEGRQEKIWRFSSSVETCCCSLDGRYIACGVVDGLVFVFEAKTRRQVAHWQAHADCGQGPLLHFLADSTYLLSAAVVTCKIWSCRTTKLINTWDTSPLTSAGISADCTLLAAGSNTGVVTMHNLPDGNSTRRLRAHRGEVWATVFSPDGSLLATGSREEPDAARLWSTETWELVQALRHGGTVFDCAFSSDGSQLVTCCADRVLRVWKDGGDARGKLADGAIGRWSCEQILSGHNDFVLSCAFSPLPAPGSSAGVVASGARDGLGRAWRLGDLTAPQPSLSGREGPVHFSSRT
eukprot:TRINITY_DN43942_c0_g1_i1.p1 TRINITY_DN43942_c0_g1~~TRINITY_DN43942_c0_g1_i1.p1  ORF type:complete len:336 (+),score=41.95 TRINITY_DN43942_c0_g1_i1:340-1347(+)